MLLDSEQVFDMLPYAVDIFEKLEVQDFIKKNKIRDAKDDEIKQKGIELVKYISKNCRKVKEEFFAIVAIAEGKTAEEIKKQPFTKTVTTFIEIFSDQELITFFKSAM